MTATVRRRRRWIRSPRRTPSELALERVDRAMERRLAQWRKKPRTPVERELLARMDSYLLGKGELPDFPLWREWLQR